VDNRGPFGAINTGPDAPAGPGLRRIRVSSGTPEKTEHSTDESNEAIGPDVD